MSRHVLIVSGGTLEGEFAGEVLEAFCRRRETDDAFFLIAVDRGLEFLYGYESCERGRTRGGILPDMIVGDFDSIQPEVIDYYKRQTHIPIREFHPVKDASDTEIAVRYAVELGCEELQILGATGTRLDHVMANIQTLAIPAARGIRAEIVDSHNRIRLLTGETHLRREASCGKYFSLFPLGGEVRGLSVAGAKYPLSDHTLLPYDSLCVSNEIEGEEAVITFGSGMVILMETRD